MNNGRSTGSSGEGETGVAPRGGLARSSGSGICFSASGAPLKPEKYLVHISVVLKIYNVKDPLEIYVFDCCCSRATEKERLELQMFALTMYIQRFAHIFQDFSKIADLRACSMASSVPCCELVDIVVHIPK